MSTARLPEQKRYFDELADLFHTFAADTDAIYRGWVTDVVPDRSTVPGSRAVDLGCGSGRFADLLADRHQHVLGVDIAERELALARSEHDRPQLRFDRRSLLDVTPEVDGRFDLVFSVNTVHHLRAHDIVLPHLRSLVGPGGDVVVVDIVDSGHWRSLDWHIAEAFRDAEDSYRARSQDPHVAAEVLHLRLHPAWLEHVTTNIPLDRAEFRRQYGAVFPGAAFVELREEVAGMHWRCPDPA
jgi:2-polyprenyl-3-methyl-5-hydroxy-6-metoxy-1,4-benzoquinol methylase